MSDAVTAPCSPSEQSSSTSPASTWFSLVSTPTNSSVPRERLSRWRVRAEAASPAGEHSQSLLLAGDGVVARQRLGVAAPDEIAARIAYVGHGHPIEAQSASHKGGRHRDAARSGVAAGLVHVHVGGLDQAAQQAGVRFVLRRCAKARNQFLYRCLRRDLALFLSAHPVGQREQPALGARLFWSGRKGAAKVILVVFAHAATVGKLRVFDVQQRIVRRALHAGIGAGSP